MRICKKCKQAKPATEEFFPRYNNNGQIGLRGSCRECFKPYDKAGISANNKKRMEKRSAKLAALKTPCVVCGWFDHPVGIDFHHLDPSTKSFTIGREQNRRWDSVVEEVNKCVCLCACCHRMVHKGIIDLEDHLRQCSRTTHS